MQDSGVFSKQHLHEIFGKTALMPRYCGVNQDLTLRRTKLSFVIIFDLVVVKKIYQQEASKMAKQRRDTANDAGRSSMVLTEETRGVPYKWISVFISVTYVFFGLRNIFFCGARLPVGEGEELVMDMWTDCKEDKVKTIFEGLHGLGDWLIGT